MLTALTWFRRRPWLVGSNRGQAMMEYLVVAGMLIASMAILVVFLMTFREYGGRILDLATSEYP